MTRTDMEAHATLWRSCVEEYGVAEDIVAGESVSSRPRLGEIRPPRAVPDSARGGTRPQAREG